MFYILAVFFIFVLSLFLSFHLYFKNTILEFINFSKYIDNLWTIVFINLIVLFAITTIIEIYKEPVFTILDETYQG